MSPQEIINKLLKTLDGSVTGFIEKLPPIQRSVYNELLLLIKDLDTYADGSIKNNLTNIQRIKGISRKIDSLVLSDPYLETVDEFIKSFSTIQELQNKYFSALNVDFTPKKVFDEIKKLNIETTVESLTESGIGANYSDVIKEVLRTNVTQGGSIADLTEIVRSEIIGSEGAEGRLVRYASEITTDALNQYSAQYNQAVTDDLGLEWFRYIGSNIEKTRPFCKAMTKKDYFHISEIPELLNGHVDGENVPLNSKTGLPQGMIEGTNENNFRTYRGGYNCGHQIFPVATVSVPEELRLEFA